MNPGHHLIGIEGLALLRSAGTGPRERVEARVAEIRRLVTDPAWLGVELEVGESDAAAGYDRWASTYDETANPLIHAEQPVVRALIDARPAGRALDAGCGTGRHTRYLAARGHDAVGVDVSAGMVERARAAAPGVDFRVGDLTALPVPDQSFDLVVCALALSHCPELEPPLAELFRVVRPGGTVVVSDMHPFHSALGFTASFVAADGTATSIRSHYHLHADYLAAFAAAGLVVRRCLEPRTREADVVSHAGPATDVSPDVFIEAFVGTPAALVWELERPA